MYVLNYECHCLHIFPCFPLFPTPPQKAQRFFVLAQTDNLWKEHLQAIKFLQQAVSLRGYAQVCTFITAFPG